MSRMATRRHGTMVALQPVPVLYRLIEIGLNFDLRWMVIKVFFYLNLLNWITLDKGIPSTFNFSFLSEEMQCLQFFFFFYLLHNTYQTTDSLMKIKQIHLAKGLGNLGLFLMYNVEEHNKHTFSSFKMAQMPIYKRDSNTKRHKILKFNFSSLHAHSDHVSFHMHISLNFCYICIT